MIPAHAQVAATGTTPFASLDFTPIAFVASGLIYACTLVFTELISNNAAAALMFPIAVATANELQVSYLPFVVGVMFSASLSFITPIGYQTNLMVYGPGGYRFMDFVRFENGRNRFDAHGGAFNADPRRIKQRLDKTGEPSRLLLGERQQFLARLGWVAGGKLLQALQREHDRRQRRTQVVRDRIEQRALELLSRLR